MTSPYPFLQPDEVITETHLSRKPASGSVWVALAGVALLCMVSGIYWTDALGLASELPATPETVFELGQYWRVFTAIGVHSDFWHLMSNALVFAVLSYVLYGYFGAMVYPVLTVGGGGLVMALSLATYPPLTVLVGASGVTYLMAGFWLTLYLFVERRFTLAKRLLRALGFGVIVLMPTVIEPAVSYRTHALGFGVGVALGVAYFYFNKDRLRAAERFEIDGAD
ncbi:MAG: rhomboid family intramembrane serine protease [Vicinamibacteria bacterium]